MRNRQLQSFERAKTMWKHVLPPVVLVIAMWLVMSGATTFYMDWVDQSHERVFSENVSSIRAADTLEAAVWRVAAEMPTDQRGAGVPQSPPASDGSRWSEQIERDCQQLRASVHSLDEERALTRLELILAEFLNHLSAGMSPERSSEASELQAWQIRTRELAGSVSAAASELKDINRALIDRAETKREKVRGPVLLARTALLVAGPALGLYFGLRIARRLQKSVATLSVTLREASTDERHALGEVTLQANGGLGDVQTQARLLIDRMRQMTDDLRSARGEVIRSERLAAVGELAAGVAHELRNPLTSVKLLLQHASRNPDGPVLSGSKLTLILEEIGRMETTIQELLDFSRPHTLSRETHDLRETLQRGLNLVDGRARQQHVDLRADFGERALWVDADSEQLSQVFVNILLNGIESMPAGGALAIDAQRCIGSPHIRVRIRDQGGGIPADVLSRLFEPFATTKDRGTGLGLAVSNRIVKDHGGTITAANHPERGAVFTVDLPATTAPALPTATTEVTHGIAACH